MKLPLLGLVMGAAAIAFMPTSLRAAEADELALAERLAAQADRYPNTSAAAPFKQAMLEAATRLSSNNLRFQRQRYRAAELAGDIDAMLDTLQQWRKLEPDNLFVQMRLIDVYLTRLQTADARLDYVKQIVDARSVDAQVRSHAAVHMARLQLEQSRTHAAMESLRRALLLNGLNREALDLQWQLTYGSANEIQRMTMLLGMLRADPTSVDVVLRVAYELSMLGMLQPSLAWYTQAATMAKSSGGLEPGALKDFAAQLLIAGQDRGAAEICSYLLERDPSDPAAWFLTLLAERDMADRIDLVRKNALIGLLNRLSMVRSELGVQGATTRPLGAEEVTLPDIADDAELLKNASPEMRAQYLAAVADVAWMLVYHDNRPQDAQRFIAVLADDPDAKQLHARLQGWALLKSGKTDEARKLLEEAGDDPLASLGRYRILKQDPATVMTATDLARQLTAAIPARLLGAYIWAEVGSAAGERRPDPVEDAIRDLLDRFPQEILRMAVAPDEFVTMRLQPQQVGHDFAEPILVDVELRNLKQLPLVVGPTGAVRDVWLDVQSRGVLNQWISGVSFEKVDGPVLLQPGAAMRWTVRLDRGPLGDVLSQSVQQAMQLSVFGLTNAVPTSAGVVPGPCGLRARMIQMLERRAASLASDAAIRRARAIVDGDDSVAKLRLIDQVAAHLYLISRPDTPDTLKAMDAEFRDLLIQLSQDASVPVKTWARYQMARMFVEPAEKTANDLVSHPVWYARVICALSAMETGETARNRTLQKLNGDEDATVRHLAAAIPAAMAKPQEDTEGVR